MSLIELQLIVKDNKTEFAPRDHISGRIVIQHLAGAWKAAHADVVLAWKTKGKGTMDEGVAGYINFAKKGQQMPPVLERDFTLPLPDLPWTYYGHHIKINWQLGLHVFGKGADGKKLDQEIILPLVVHPDPDSIRRSSNNYLPPLPPYTLPPAPPTG